MLLTALPATALAEEPGGARTSSDEIVRGEAGNLGMFFRFGGLASLFAGGDTRPIAQGLLLTQFGVKIVINEELMVPIFFGAAFRRFAQDGGPDAISDWGFDAGGGLEYHFRIWNRISPYAGFSLGLGYTNPDGGNNASLGFSIGPLAGVEFYIFDRVSLSAQYTFLFQVVRLFDQSTVTSVQTLAGGAMNLTYYF